MKKWAIIIGVILVLAGIGSALSKKEAAQEADTKARVAKDAEAVSAEAIFKAYKDNEVGADERFKGRFVKVEGIVSNIGKDLLDDMYVTFEVPGSIFEVQAYFGAEEKRAVAQLTKGQRLTAVCMGEGKALNVHMKKCTVVK